jgi:Na+-translocating ferredoxin:NAD+ oxidoreductase RNF subunit RnfB
MLEFIFPSAASILSLSAVAFISALLLSYAKIKLKVEKDPRIELILQCLPNADCGACGLSDCLSYSTVIVENKYDINLCIAGDQDVIDEIAEIMEIDSVQSNIAMTARVMCRGGIRKTSSRFFYEGPKSCKAASSIMGGFKVCEYGCLGLGDCYNVCPFGAITMAQTHLPVIDNDTCIGCGNCVSECPRHIIRLVQEDVDVHIMCSNKENPDVMKLGCSVGCTGCNLCVKTCTDVFKDNTDIDSAATVNDFLADIDYAKCINCLKCAEVCPVPVINPLSAAKNLKKNKSGKYL